MLNQRIVDLINDRKVCPRTGRLRKDVCFHIYRIKNDQGTTEAYGLYCVVNGVKEKVALLVSKDLHDLKESYVYAIRQYA